MSNSNRLPDVLTEAEQESLLSQPNPRYPTGQRNYTLLRIMLDTDIRSSEAVSLKWDKVDFSPFLNIIITQTKEFVTSLEN